MSTKKVTVLTINSLSSLSKLHSSPVSLVAAKSLGLVRNFNIATERFDVQNPGSSGENHLDYQQNGGGYYNNIPNLVDLQHNSNYGYSQRSNYKGEIYQHPHTFHKVDALERGFKQEPNVSSENYIDRKVANLRGEHNRNGFEGNPNGQNRNSFGGYHGEYQQNSMGQGVKLDEKNVWQNPNNCSTSIQNGNNDNNWQNQGSANNNNGNVGMKQSPDNYGQNYATTYQQGIGGTPYAGIRNEHLQNIGGQSPMWNQNVNSGHFQSNSDQSPMLNNSEIGAEGYKGTIEELDNVCKEGKMEEVVQVLELLSKNQIPVDLSRYLMLMAACGEAEAAKEAKIIHKHLMTFMASDLKVNTYNKILEMYGKCGSMDDAVAVFHKMPIRNLTSWDTMISGFVKHDQGENALDMFTQFKESGLKPDGEMFIGVFNACGLVGDIIEGMFHFQSMSKDYGIVPTMEHYNSVVKMMGTVGYLDEALEFIEKKMPFEPSVEIWETLMNFCRVYGHVEVGDRCVELIELMDPTRLHDQSKAGLIPVKASDLEKEKLKKKLAAGNLLAVRSRTHEYRAGDNSHPETERIYTMLRGMKEQMKEAGYVAETRFVLHDIDQESKEEALLAHSERLAVAYGLMTSPARAQMRIIKNLRVCGDCHSALKIISKLVGRELVIRDAKRFHHFKDGLCSCKDYW